MYAYRSGNSETLRAKGVSAKAKMYVLVDAGSVSGKFGRQIIATVEVQGESFIIRLPKAFDRELSLEHITEINAERVVMAEQMTITIRSEKLAQCLTVISYHHQSRLYKIKFFKKLVKEIFLGMDHYEMATSQQLDGNQHFSVYYLNFKDHSCSEECFGSLDEWCRFVKSRLRSWDYLQFIFVFDKFMEDGLEMDLHAPRIHLLRKISQIKNPKTLTELISTFPIQHLPVPIETSVMYPKKLQKVLSFRLNPNTWMGKYLPLVTFVHAKQERTLFLLNLQLAFNEQRYADLAEKNKLFESIHEGEERLVCEE